jgi:HD-like signal output (HDOD) protein
VQNKRAFKIHTRCRVDDRSQTGRFLDLPDVPVLPETLLCMELSTFAASIHLNDLADLVLGDLGATIQIIRAANRECSAIEGRFNRVEDCISSLGVDGCFEAIARESSAGDGERWEIKQAWQHARDIAWKMKSLAEELGSEVNSGDAYLVGLLHELDQLPVLLLWQSAIGFSSDSEPSGLALARAWSLPECILEYFLEMQDSSKTGRWSEMVRKVHGMQKVIEMDNPTASPIPAHLLAEKGARSVAR